MGWLQNMLQACFRPAPPVLDAADFTWAPSTGADLRTLQAEANRTAFLLLIRKCEGTDGPDGYRMMFGGKLFTSFADHPRLSWSFTNSRGVVQWSTAAGAYQFIVSTWDDVRAKLHLPDFSPPSQDAAAIELIRRAGAVDDVEAGRLNVAVAKCAPTWASLPGGPYPQPQRDIAFCRAAFVAAGGVVAV